MHTSDWKRAKRAFQEALDAEPDRRDDVLSAVCGQDDDLRARVAALLAAHEASGGFLRPPVVPTSTRPAPPEPDEERPGDRVGNYRLVSVLGEGGCGIVYEAEQLSPVRRPVALKVIKPGMDSRQVVSRFATERQALALMDHPGIAHVYDAGETQHGRPFIVMELIRGIPITADCDARNATIPHRLELFQLVCHAVQHAHQKGVIHRDLKPSNVLVAEQDGAPTPKVIDFGIAKATRDLAASPLTTEAGQCPGTPIYMSPEQADGGPEGVDTRSDVYSLGVLLYELLTGTPPFTGDDGSRSARDALRRRIREETAERPSTRVGRVGHSDTVAAHRGLDPASLARRLRGDLDWIVGRALEKEPDRRYGSPADLAEDVRRYLAHEPVRAGPPGLGYRVSRFARRHVLGVVATAAVLLALVAGLLLAVWGLVEARHANEELVRHSKAADEVAEFLVEVFDVNDPNAARGDTVTAREVLDRAAARIDRELADQPLVRARLQHVLGRVYRNLGLFDAAERLLEEAWTTRRELLGEGHPDTLSTADVRARLSITRGRHEEAAERYRENHETSLRALGPDHVATLRARGGLGNALRLIGQLSDSERHLRAAVEGLQRLSGADDRLTISMKTNLAVVHKVQGRWDTASALFQEVLDAVALEGPDDPIRVAVLEESTAILQVEGRYAEAQAALEELVDHRLRVLGPSHRDTLRARRQMAANLTNLGRQAEAEGQLLQILQDQRAWIGEDDETGARSTLVTLGRLCASQERHAEAGRFLGEAVGMLGKRPLEDHPQRLLSVCYLAETWSAQGLHAPAEVLVEAALDAQCRVMPGNDVIRSRALMASGRVLAASRKHAPARRAFHEAWELRTHLYDPGHPSRRSARLERDALSPTLTASSESAP